MWGGTPTRVAASAPRRAPARGRARTERARAAVVAGRDVQACHRLLARLAPLDFAAEDATPALLRAAPLPARAAVGQRPAPPPRGGRARLRV